MMEQATTPALRATVIIAFYNKWEFLELVLAGLERQTVHDFEVIIADDGSHHEVVGHIKDYMAQSKLHIQHLWHADEGWQKNRIMNRAIKASRSPYLIFLDGDCIPHRHFVRAHLQHQTQGVVLTGRRVNLSPRLTTHLTAEKVRRGFLEPTVRQFYDALRGAKDVEKGLYIRNAWLHKRMNRKQRGVLGCNFSVWKGDMEQINGFDERYRMPTVGEDTDVEYRLHLVGIRTQTVKFSAIQYHLWHPRLSRAKQHINNALFNETKALKRSRAPEGLDELG